MYDGSGEGPIATEMRRDADRILEEDNFQVILDTFQDYRSAYMFVVNPLGARLDQQVFAEGGRSRRSSGSAVNRAWDGVWSVGTQRVNDGWIAEIAIPMVTLRFPESEPQSWGINFMRNIRRKNEQVFWAPIPRARMAIPFPHQPYPHTTTLFPAQRTLVARVMPSMVLCPVP